MLTLLLSSATGEDETPRGPRKRITAFLVDVGAAGFVCRQGPDALAIGVIILMNCILIMCA